MFFLLLFFPSNFYVWFLKNNKEKINIKENYFLMFGFIMKNIIERDVSYWIGDKIFNII